MNNTFTSKRKEIRGKLTRSLLSNIEEYKMTVKEEELTDDMYEFRKKLEAGLINAKKDKPVTKRFYENLLSFQNRNRSSS